MGGWNDQKEQTRKDVADFFSVNKEEIALIHNTTEGMNLIAKSFNLEKGVLEPFYKVILK